MSTRVAYLQLVIVSFLWGGNYVVSAYLLHGFSPIALGFLRMTATTLLITLPSLVTRNLRWPDRREWGLIAGMAFFATLLNQVLYFSGLQHSTPGNASLIIALSPLATILLARMFLREIITFWKALGALIGFAGVAVIVLSSTVTHSHAQSVIGDVYLFGAMLALSISLIFVRRLSATMPTYTMTVFASLVGMGMMAPAAAVEVGLHHSRIAHSVGVWFLLITASALAQGLAGFWWNQGVAVVGASASSMFMNIPPFIALFVAHVLLHDAIHGTQIIGGIAILGGVLIANRHPRIKRSPEVVTVDAST